MKAVATLAAALVLLFCAAMWATCETAWDTRSTAAGDERNREPCSRGGDCSGGNCRQVEGECSDDDQTTVILCLQPDACRFG